MAIFYSLLMCINVLCAFSIFLSGIAKRQHHFLALAALNILLLVYHWVTLDMLSTSDARESLWLNRVQLACIIIGYPLYVCIFGVWTRYKYAKSAAAWFAGFSTLLLIFNFASDGSLRHGIDATLVQYVTVFGDSAYLLSGDVGGYFVLIHLLYGTVGLFFGFSAYRFYKKAHNGLAAILTLTIFMQIGASFIGYQIDSLQSSLVYMGGVPMTILSIFTLGIISLGYKQKSTMLRDQLSEKASVHSVFSKLAAVSNEDGASDFYFESLSLLSEFSDADFVLLGLVDEKNHQNITTKIAFKDNQLIDNFSYERKGTPCENVLSYEPCVHSEGVAADYPHDLMLEHEGIEAYIGYPIFGNNNQTEGVLVLLYKCPLHSESTLRAVTDVFATRISAEIRREKLQDELKATAYVDYLTQLPNRMKLVTFIDKAKNAVIAEESQALLMLFDLDYFTEVNRKYGYEVGDQVIKVIGERLRSYAGDGIFIARCSGDEFAIVIPNIRTSVMGLVNVHWTAIKSIINQTALVGHRKIHIGCSMGAVVFPVESDNTLDELGCAENALMQAKAQGRDRFAFFDPALISQIEYSRALSSDLVDAIKGDDGLEVYYQPKVDKHGRIVGAEALLRWFSTKRGFVSPAEFIPIAEDSGVIHDLGKWVIDCVIDDIKDWSSGGYNLVTISINATASQFEDEEFIDYLISSLVQSELPASLIELELTESGLLQERNKAIATLDKVRSSGITIALDDFGTGYSSLSYLSTLPLDVLKIDKSFVDELDDKRNLEVVKSIIAISEAMELVNVAEGTEREEQVDLLASLGCQYFQGYYFSKPINKDEFSDWLAKI